MKKAPIALLVAGLSVGFAVSSVDFQPDRKVIAEVGRAVVAGVILGADAWSYNFGPRPTEVEARLLLRPAVCDWRGQCDSAAVDSAALTAETIASRSE